MCTRGLVIEGENPCHAALLHHMLTLANPFFFEMAPDCNLGGSKVQAAEIRNSGMADLSSAC